MSSFEKSVEFDRTIDVIVAHPVAEVLQNTTETKRVWPEICSEDSAFVDQIELRNEQSSAIISMLDQLTDATMSIEEALGSGVVNSRQATDFYTSLSEILNDKDYRRIVLYVPFELLPEVTQKFDDTCLQDAAEEFKTSYMTAWYNLLGVEDVRANFIDGDILEEEQKTGNLPRVVKAAHLIPMLTERGLLTEIDVQNILENTDSLVLRQSIIEVLEGYEDSTVSLESENEISDRRKQWLQQEKREQDIISGSGYLAQAIAENDLPDKMIEYAVSATKGELLPHIVAEGIYTAINSASDEQAIALYEQYSDVLTSLWEKNDEDLTGRLVSIYRRLHRLGVVDSSMLASLDISITDLGGKWSENLANMQNEIGEAEKFVESIDMHQELSALVYPVILVSGSRLKGYGGNASDVDVEIFIKPGVSRSIRPRIQELMSAVVGGNSKYELTEFWLDENSDETLFIHDSEDPSRHMGDSYSPHVLFGGAWVGDEQAVFELQQKLLPNYFIDSEDRRLYLEKLEQDALQYRLMHKGYAKQYPLVKRNDDSALPVDSSVFWDSGYRQIATKLFVSNVFLPKLIKK